MIVDLAAFLIGPTLQGTKPLNLEPLFNSISKTLKEKKVGEVLSVLHPFLIVCSSSATSRFLLFYPQALGCDVIWASRVYCSLLKSKVGSLLWYYGTWMLVTPDSAIVCVTSASTGWRSEEVIRVHSIIMAEIQENHRRFAITPKCLILFRCS